MQNGNLAARKDTPSAEGYTPLMIAAVCGRAASARALLDCGAALHRRSRRGATALHFAGGNMRGKFEGAASTHGASTPDANPSPLSAHRCLAALRLPCLALPCCCRPVPRKPGGPSCPAGPRQLYPLLCQQDWLSPAQRAPHSGAGAWQLAHQWRHLRTGGASRRPSAACCRHCCCTSADISRLCCSLAVTASLMLCNG